MNRASCSTTCLALGPGSCMSRRGNFVSCDFVSFNFVSGVAIISSSFKGSQLWLWVDDFCKGHHPVLLPQNAIAENGVPRVRCALTRVALHSALFFLKET